MTIKDTQRTGAELYPGNFLDSKVARPISAYIAYGLQKFGITANQVTIVNHLIGLSGCALLAFGTHSAIIWGSSLLLLNFLLDRVDGDIARITNTCSKFGRLLDSFGDFLVDMLLPICIGIGLYYHPAFGISGMVYLLAGFTFSLLRSLRRRITLFSSLVTGKNTFDAMGHRSLVVQIGLVIVSVEPVVLLLLAIADALGIFLLSYGLLTICELFIYSGLVLKRTHKEGNDEE